MWEWDNAGHTCTLERKAQFKPVGNCVFTYVYSFSKQVVRLEHILCLWLTNHYLVPLFVTDIHPIPLYNV